MDRAKVLYATLEVPHVVPHTATHTASTHPMICCGIEWVPHTHLIQPIEGAVVVSKYHTHTQVKIFFVVSDWSHTHNSVFFIGVLKYTHTLLGQ